MAADPHPPRWRRLTATSPVPPTTSPPSLPGASASKASQWEGTAPPVLPPKLDLHRHLGLDNEQQEGPWRDGGGASGAGGGQGSIRAYVPHSPQPSAASQADRPTSSAPPPLAPWHGLNSPREGLPLHVLPQLEKLRPRRPPPPPPLVVASLGGSNLQHAGGVGTPGSSSSTPAAAAQRLQRSPHEQQPAFVLPPQQEPAHQYVRLS